ncbi:hypothetical protein J6590_034455 [Homalodisca vitripennis]|nr:hypothetical protein J6590_034455 [Homalodisca vitripennis]
MVRVRKIRSIPEEGTGDECKASDFETKHQRVTHMWAINSPAVFRSVEFGSSDSITATYLRVLSTNSVQYLFCCVKTNAAVPNSLRSFLVNTCVLGTCRPEYRTVYAH